MPRPSLLQSERLQSVLIVCGVLPLLWLLFFWRVLTPTLDDRVIFNQEGDFILHFYAPIAYQVERLQDGDLPLWNPYNYAGEPSAANIQNGSFYPPRFVSVALLNGADYTVAIYQLETALHYLLASITMYLFLTYAFRQPGLALVGAILYAYRGYMTGYAMLQASTIATEAWLPLMLLGVYLSFGRWRITGAVTAGVSFALILLAGRPQAAFYLGVLLAAVLIFKAAQARNWRGLVWRGALIGGIGVGLAAIQLLPMAELTSESYRVIDQSYTDKGNGFGFAELIGFGIPGLNGAWSPLYAGLIALLLAVGHFFGRIGRESWFWGGVLAVALLLSLGQNSVIYDFFYAFIPGFDLFRNQERAASLVTFALVMLAILSLHEYRFTHPRGFTWAVYAVMALLVSVYVCLSVALLLGADAPQLVAGTDAFGLLALVAVGFAFWLRFAREIQPAGIAWGLLALLIVFDLFTVGTRSVNFVDDIPANQIQLAEALEPLANTPPEAVTWRVDGAAGLQGRGILFDIPDIYGLGAISLATPEQLYSLPVDRYWEVLAVRYATATDEPPADVPLELLAYGANYDGQEFQLFELQDPRPLAHLVYDYRHAQGDAAFARLIMADAAVNLREMAVTLQPLPFELPVERPAVSAVDDFTIHSPEYMTMRVSTGADALLTLALVDYPGWQATVNGQPVDTVDVYAGLVGVPLRAGMDQTVEIRFVSSTVETGAAISLATIMFVLALLGWRAVVGVRRNTHTAEKLPS